MKYLIALSFLFTIVPAYLNAQASLNPISDQIIEEDAGEQSVALNGISNTTSFNVTTNNINLLPLSNIFIDYTSPDATGTLRYTIVNDGFGETNVTITPVNGMVEGTPVIFKITVNGINDPPNFEIKDPIIVDEDAGPQSEINWAFDINPGGSGNFFEVQDINFNLNITNTTSNLAFDEQPSLSPQGILKFTSAPNTNGTATIEVSLIDNGPSSPPPNNNTSAVKVFQIIVNAVNDRPTFTSGGNVEILEDAGPITISGWATNISPGGGDDELSQSLTFNANIVGTIDNLTFLIEPSINPTTGDLSFEANADDFGQATLKVTLVDDGDDVSPNNNTSIEQSFTITVNPVNDPPTFVIPDSLIVREDEGLKTITQFVSSISKGPDNELDQSINFSLEILEQTDFLTFRTSPQLAETGTLTFEANPDANGTAKIQVTCTDSGPGDDPNQNTAIEEFILIVEAVNDAPSFDGGPEITINEDDIGSFANWASNISPGPADEVDQTLNFVVNEIGTTGILGFDINPQISSEGLLEFQTSANTNGQSSFEVFLVDDGKSDEFNENTSSRVALSITVVAVNDPPVFNAGPDPTSDENIGFVQISDWATDISPGGGEDEVNQQLEFLIEPVEFSGNLGFAIGPVIETDGTLSYQSTANTFGFASFLITLVDDGPDQLPNNNASESQFFTITVNEVNDPPSDILLSNNKVEELRDPGVVIGTFGALDPDDDTHVFSLVAGDGSEDNSNFTIDGSQLLSAVSFSFDERTLHNIRVSASDGDNTFESQFIIEVIRQPVSGVNFANAFTPNGDGANDQWIIEDIEFFPACEVSILDQYGKRVYFSNGYKVPWDGTFDGRELPAGTYYYVIDLKNGSDVLRGDVTILR